jgi:hypothetical protein
LNRLLGWLGLQEVAAGSTGTFLQILVSRIFKDFSQFFARYRQFFEKVLDTFFQMWYSGIKEAWEGFPPIV